MADQLNMYNIGYEDGYARGYEVASREKFSDFYDKLCAEIRDSVKEEFLQKIKESFNER